MTTTSATDGESLAIGGQLQRAGAVVAVGVVLLGLFAAGAEVSGQDFRYFSKEPAESLGGKPYAGWLAHVTVLAWASAAATALFAGATLRLAGRREQAALLLAAGGLSTLLVLDDFFMLHEAVYPRLGLPEEVVYLAYGVLLVAIAWRFRSQLRRHDRLLMLLALVLWTASVGLDFVQETWGVHLHLLEDGAKVTGVLLWSAFLVGAAGRELLGAARTSSAAGEPDASRPAPDSAGT